MSKTLPFALAILLAAVAGASAQQPGVTPRATTPGVPAGTTGTTYDTPGALPTQTTPGGTVPQAAGTQDKSLRPYTPRTYNNSASAPR